MTKIREGVSSADEQACVELWIQALLYRDGQIDAETVALRARRKFEHRTVRFGIVGQDAMAFALTVEKATEAGDNGAFIELLAVKPVMAGRGYGRALLLDAIDAAKKAELSAIGLEVRDSNAAALGLYQSAGFKRSGKPRPHPLGGDPMITMNLSLH